MSLKVHRTLRLINQRGFHLPQTSESRHGSRHFPPQSHVTGRSHLKSTVSPQPLLSPWPVRPGLGWTVGVQLSPPPRQPTSNSPHGPVGTGGQERSGVSRLSPLPTGPTRCTAAPPGLASHRHSPSCRRTPFRTRPQTDLRVLCKLTRRRQTLPVCTLGKCSGLCLSMVWIVAADCSATVRVIMNPTL